MTKLEDRIREEIGNFCGDTCAELSAPALLGVLDLHVPEEIAYIDRTGNENSGPVCEVCGDGGQTPGELWPCPTVVAIARGLGVLGNEGGGD